MKHIFQYYDAFRVVVFTVFDNSRISNKLKTQKNKKVGSFYLGLMAASVFGY